MAENEGRSTNRERMLARSRLLMMVLLREMPLLVRVLRQMQGGLKSGHEGREEIERCPECAGTGCKECDYQGWFRITAQSRTEAAALNADRARKDFRQLDWLIEDIDKKLNELDSIRTYWTVTVKGLPSGMKERGCRSCARIKIDVGGEKVDKWSPRQQLPDDPEQVDAEGNPIPRFSPFCQWCGDWNRAEGEYPPLKVLEAHHEGRRITNSLLKRLGVETKMSARDRRKKAS